MYNPMHLQVHRHVFLNMIMRTQADETRIAQILLPGRMPYLKKGLQLEKHKG